LVLGHDGNFYGGSWFGGTYNRGVIYRVTPAGEETVIYNIPTPDPACQYTPQIVGTNGTLYGTATDCADGGIFEVTTSGTFTILYTFDGTDGSGPALAFQGTNGELYGYTASGGANSGGTFFKITTSGTLTLTTLYSFGKSTSVVYQPEGIILGKDGNYYGAGASGGNSYGCGGVFKLTPSGKLTVLYDFSNSPDGCQPFGLVQGSDGNLYGVTQYGGNTSNGWGAIYKMTTSGKETILHSVNSDTDDGAFPTAALTEGSDGNFYSTMNSCNNFGCNPPGNVYEITPAGVFTVLGVFNNTNGSQPGWGVIQHPNGSFYGVADYGGTGDCGCGVVFKVNNKLGAFAKLLGTSGIEGSVVGILGEGFTSASVVEFGGVKATTITRSGGALIDATVPSGALTGAVKVTTGSTTLTSWQTFDVTPTLKTFSPTSGDVGALVTITGTGLTQTTKVTFNGKSAALTVHSDAQVTATVPAGATSGKIVVTTEGGTVTSTTSFTVN
jgi:uncharacterized repeat protein (TIGR03803 family)